MKVGSQRNSKLAWKLAEIYEEMVGHEFPGGPGNAFIYRTRAGKYQRSEGAWSWSLCPIYHEFIKTLGHPAEFGSAESATECIRLHKKGKLTFLKYDRGILGEFELM